MEAKQLIDQEITRLGDWRGDMLAAIRRIVLKADPELTEEWKWNTPVWSRGGMVCAVGAFKDHIKINFFKGASLEDPQKLLNAGLEAKISRSIDLREGDSIDEQALIDLVRAAVANNISK